MDAAARRLHELLMEVVRAIGLLHLDQLIPDVALTLSQVFALHELDTGATLSQRDLAGRLRLDKSSVSRLATDLERRGLLVRERDPDNRRLYRLRLTDAGRDVHARMAGVFHAQYLRWTAAMTGAERDALLAGLPALVRAIAQCPPPWTDQPATAPASCQGPGGPGRHPSA